MLLRSELYCYFCGHGSGEVVVATRTRRPTTDQLKAAYADITGPGAPVWDAGEQPTCPRCGGQMFLERYGEQARRRAPLRKAS